MIRQLIFVLSFLMCVPAFAAEEEFWMWGHHPDSFDRATSRGEGYNLPKGRRIDMADACRQLGVDRCCVVRWTGLPEYPYDDYAGQFTNLSEFAWSVTDSGPETFEWKCKEALRLADKYANLTTYFLDDFFCGENGQWKRHSPEEIRSFRDKVRVAATPGRLACVLYADTNGVKAEYKPWLDVCDVISFWFWNGKNLDTMRAKVGELRALVGKEKTVLLGIYLWDFGGRKPLTRAETSAQLETAGRLLDEGLVNGLIFHCTPLVDLGLESVDCARDWLRARRQAKLAAQEVKVAPVFSDGAVLQRDRPVPVWGTAKPGLRVTVAFAGQEKTTTAVADGTWRVTLDPMSASKEPRDLIVTSAEPSIEQSNNPNNRTILHDILVGEVWFVSGQSNAVCPIWCETRPNFRDLKGGTVIQYVKRDDVRFTDTPGVWKKMNSRTLTGDGLSGGSFSALGVYFGLKLNYVLDVPVGLVGNYMNGSPIRRWTPTGAFYRTYVKRWMPYAIRGLLWNQGDADNENPDYCRLLHELYDGWSRGFENAEMSFYLQEQSHGTDDCFQLTLAQERFVREEPHAAISGGNDLMLAHVDVHGNDKEWMARRMLLHALKRDYGRTDIDDESPVLESAFVEGNAVVCTFANARTLYLYNADTRSRRSAFEVAGTDGVWHAAEPVFDPCGAWAGENYTPTNVLRIVSKEVPGPVAVRYLGAKRSFGNVYNQAALPMLPFEWRSNLEGKP